MIVANLPAQTSRVPFRICCRTLHQSICYWHFADISLEKATILSIVAWQPDSFNGVWIKVLYKFKKLNTGNVWTHEGKLHYNCNQRVQTIQKVKVVSDQTWGKGLEVGMVPGLCSCSAFSFSLHMCDLGNLFDWSTPERVSLVLCWQKNTLFSQDLAWIVCFFLIDDQSSPWRTEKSPRLEFQFKCLKA